MSTELHYSSCRWQSERSFEPRRREGREGFLAVFASLRFKSALTAITVLAILAGCGNSNNHQRAEAPPVPVRVAQVERKTVPVTVRAIGTVEAIETVAVTARVGGELVRVSFAEGQNVSRGAPLLTVDPRPYEADLREAEARLTRDRAQLAKAEADVRRYADLVKRDFVTKEQYDQITATAAALAATIQEDEAAVESARLQLGYCTITAPVSGRTGSLQVRLGNLVKANDDHTLVTINQTRPIYVSFALPSQYLAAVKRRLQQGIQVEAMPGSGEPVQTGELTLVDNAVDPTTGTILLKATFPNPDEVLWPGLFVDVKVVLGEEADRVVAPATAVQTGQSGAFVFVVKEDQTVELRSVQVARADDREAVVDEGLTGGETVVTDGQLRLVPGAKVSIPASPEARP